LEKAIEKNVIIYLRTGSGKTYIAVMLIKHFAEQVEKPYSQGGRRTIFLANNVPLVMQQAEFLRNHTYLNVGEYYGDRLLDNKLLDCWDQTTWDKELEKNQILVMSPQILVDMLQHSFIGKRNKFHNKLLRSILIIYFDKKILIKLIY
jgi:endoribonuclease Dicer